MANKKWHSRQKEWQMQKALRRECARHAEGLARRLAGLEWNKLGGEPQERRSEQGTRRCRAF